jgi:hypothetical protein
MITKGDDYPVHQTSDPIAYAGSDRNFYDRYFFNGYSHDGELFFALALGVYPLLDVMDAAFSVMHRGQQTCVFASRVLAHERMDTQVGPIAIEVVEPLQRLRVRVAPNPHGLAADLLFEARALPLEEPPYRRRIGTRVLMDLTRMTQHGSYRGWIEVNRERLAVEPQQWWGTRDRSWGIRPVGERDPAGLRLTSAVPLPVLQFYWLWTALHFEDRVVLFDTNEDADGRAWHRHAVIATPGDGEPEPMVSASHRLEFKSGTRHAKFAELTLRPLTGPEQRVELEPLWFFPMMGIGYGHPDWSHGVFRGEEAVGGEQRTLDEVDESLPQFQHIQAFCRARMGAREGIGMLEQFILGPHAPSGFKNLLDMAP